MTKEEEAQAVLDAMTHCQECGHPANQHRLLDYKHQQMVYRDYGLRDVFSGCVRQGCNCLQQPHGAVHEVEWTEAMKDEWMNPPDYRLPVFRWRDDKS